jgi:hypothetical protein
MMITTLTIKDEVSIPGNAISYNLVIEQLLNNFSIDQYNLKQIYAEVRIILNLYYA